MEAMNKKILINDAFIKYSDMVVRIAFQNLKDFGSAEDIAQDVFVKLLTFDDFENDNHLKAWLARVTINMCRNHRKLFWNRMTGPITDAAQLMDTRQFSCEEPYKEILDEIWKLPIHYRNTVYLYYYEGYSISEIAELLDKKENTVSSWLTRARKKLKKIFTDGEYLYEY